MDGVSAPETRDAAVVPSSRSRRRGLAVAAWGLAVVLASLGMWLHAAAPGAPAEAPGRWPAEAGLARASGRPTLLVFAHPACACTKATLGELARLLANVGDRVEAHVLVETYEGLPAPEETAAWQAAAAIPGVDVRRDPDRREAARFGAETSGQVLLYDAAGVLRFAGGITPGRGEEGASAGRAGLERVLAQAGADARAPVFGCSLSSTDAPLEADRDDRSTAL